MQEPPLQASTVSQLLDVLEGQQEGRVLVTVGAIRELVLMQESQQDVKPPVVRETPLREDVSELLD